MRLTWNTFASPLGRLTVVECPDGPLMVQFPHRAGTDHGSAWVDRLRRGRTGVAIVGGPCRRLETWLRRYFEGRPMPFAYPGYLSEYLEVDEAQETIWRFLTQIPEGETRSYADLAELGGTNPRAVGQIVGSNPLAICIPCHRVVGKHGELVGYGGGRWRKRWLLNHEIRTSGVVLR